jgi:serine/threonine protein phosphatase 1
LIDNEKIFAVGDIHGCLDKLKRLISRLDVAGTDTVIFLGDYIDRGPDPKGVVDFLIRFSDECKGRVIFLKGNHEVMFLDYLKGLNREAYLYYGGTSTVESYSREKGVFYLPEEHRRFFDGLGLFYEVDDYVFVHAGLRPGVPIESQSEYDMLWIRAEFIDSDYDWGKRVIFGHTAFMVPDMDKNKIGIDTGAVYGRELTCLILPDMDFIFA